jgi:AraC-like DNA-binding protein
MLLFLSILGIFLSIILVAFNARKNASTIYLGVFFFLLSLYIFYQYVLLYSKSVFLISMVIANISISTSPLFLIGPMLYWYTRSVLTDNAKLTKKDMWHCLPMIIFFIAALPHAFIPWQEKVEAARAVVADAGFMGVYRATLLAKIFTPTLEYLTRPILVLGYTLWSAGLFINYLIKKRSSVVLSKQQFMKKWLFLLLGFLLVLELTQILLIIRAFEMHFSDMFFALNVIRILSGAGLIGLLISPFFFPTILYGLPRMPEPIIPPEPEEVKTVLSPEEEGNYYSRFESDYLHSIGWKTDSYMKEFQPYLQPDFNLAQLSVNTQIPVHHIGYYFREVKKQHFIEYRNKWRINHAKSLIKEGKAKELTLEAIGKMSGFSSRNTFRTTFEKIEGIPPSTFASQIKE